MTTMHEPAALRAHPGPNFDDTPEDLLRLALQLTAEPRSPRFLIEKTALDEWAKSMYGPAKRESDGSAN